MRRLAVVVSIGVICLLGITPALAGKYKEAPMLEAKVKAGQLPPVDERLPKEPKVLTRERNEVPSKCINLQIGQYGGVLRTVQPDPGWHPDIFVANDEPLLSAPGILAEGVGENVAKGYEASADGKVFTFYLREGLKWSDGVPVTTEDVRFTYEDVLLNKKITPVFPKWMKSGNRADGTPLKVEIVDDYTFRVVFDQPYGGFPAQLAILFWKGYTELLKPKHYLKQFHIKYTPLEELEPLIQERALGKGEWWTLFNQKDARNWDLTRPKALGFPTLNPWVMVKITPTVVTYERNPYYFKVDAEGNQLPYIDGIRSEVVADVEMSTMKVINGEADFLREDAVLSNLALYKENAEKAGFKPVLLSMHMSPADVCINQTHPDPVWRQVVTDPRFRRALSIGIDREVIIDSLYFGFAEFPKSVPSEYDPEKANQLLDEVGLNRRDADGWRLGPDGKPFVIPFEVSMLAPDIVPLTEMIVEYYKELGLKATMKTIDPGLRSTRASANELKATMAWKHGPELWWGALWDWVPGSWGTWGRLWQVWFDTAGKEGEEPPDDVKEFVDLINKSIVASPSERQKYIDAYRRMHYENLYTITVTEKAQQPLIVPANMENVPFCDTAITANFAAEQFFFKK